MSVQNQIEAACLLAHIEGINAQIAGTSKFHTNIDMWNQSGIFSPIEFDKAIAVETLHNVVKDITGVRPRWIDTDEMSIEEIEQETRDYLYDAREDRRREHREKSERARANRYRPNRAMELALSKAIILSK